MRRRGEEGAAILEFAMVLPILLVIITAMAPLIKAGYEYMVLQRAVAHGVRYASRADVNARPADSGGLTRRPSPEEVSTFVTAAALPVNVAVVAVSPSPRLALPGEQIEVTATYQLEYGYLGEVANSVKSLFFGGDNLVTDRPVTVSARGREE